MSASGGGLALLGASLSTETLEPSVTSLDSHVELAERALEDAEIELREVDGLVTFGSFTMPHSMHPMTVADRLGLRGLRYAECAQIGGASAVAALHRVAALVAGGTCRVVLLVGADNQRSGIATAGALAAMFANRHPVYEQPYGPTTAALYALRATRYLHDNGLAPSMLSHASVAARRQAFQSGLISAEELVTAEEVDASRMIASPLRLFHCSKVSDGGAAVVVAPAREGGGEVRVLGAGEYHRSGYFVHGSGSGPVGAGEAARSACTQAGVEVADIHLAYVYDAFASSLGATVEELGFAERGTAFQEFADGAFGREGRVVINPHGGLLALGNPGYASGIIHLAAATADLKAGRLPAESNLALVHGSGGVMSTQAVAVLERS